MDEHCPECGNEIYTPFTYCNACGWEKKVKEKSKVKKKSKEERTPSKKKSKKKSIKEEMKKSKKKTEKIEEEGKSRKKHTEEVGAPLKITCKCGGVIRIKSLKRPLKFNCPDCGKRGVLKGPGPELSTKKRKPKKESSKKMKGQTKKKSMSYDEELNKEEFDGNEFTDEEYDEEDIEEFEDIEELKESKLRKRIQPEREIDRRRHKEKMKRRDSCPDCGEKLSKTGNCPSCGYPVKSKPKDKSNYETISSKQKKPKFRPPESAYVVKPVKGKCTYCKSQHIRYFDDGSGRCSNCGKEFTWGGGSTRIHKKEYFCQRCRKPLEYIEEYKEWYCYNCNEYA